MALAAVLAVVAIIVYKIAKLLGVVDVQVFEIVHGFFLLSVRRFAVFRWCKYITETKQESWDFQLSIGSTYLPLPIYVKV